MLSALVVQYNVIMALYLRELKTRFGTNVIGYFWPFLEPLSHVAILAIVFSFRGSEHITGLNFLLIFTTGIIPFLLFQSIATRSINAIESNQGLFNYRQVKPLDTIISRTILETFIYTSVLIFMLIVLGGVFEYSYQVNDLMMIYLSFFTLIIFSFSWGVMFMISATLIPATKKIIPILTKPLYFISGIFFTVAEIPEGIRGYMLYNPILNMIEWIRASMFVEMGGNINAYYDLGYILSFTLISFFTAMLLYKRYKIRILTSS